MPYYKYYFSIQFFKKKSIFVIFNSIIYLFVTLIPSDSWFSPNNRIIEQFFEQKCAFKKKLIHQLLKKSYNFDLFILIRNYKSLTVLLGNYFFFQQFIIGLQLFLITVFIFLVSRLSHRLRSLPKMIFKSFLAEITSFKHLSEVVEYIYKSNICIYFIYSGMAICFCVALFQRKIQRIFNCWDFN